MNCKRSSKKGGKKYQKNSLATSQKRLVVWQENQYVNPHFMNVDLGRVVCTHGQTIRRHRWDVRHGFVNRFPNDFSLRRPSRRVCVRARLVWVAEILWNPQVRIRSDQSVGFSQLASPFNIMSSLLDTWPRRLNQTAQIPFVEQARWNSIADFCRTFRRTSIILDAHTPFN